MALSFTDSARNVEIYSGVVVRGSQTSPVTLALELLDTELTNNELLQEQCRETVGEQVWTVNIAPLL